MNLRHPSGPGLQLIGVTGHRDLDEADRPALERAVQACLSEIEALVPDGQHRLLCGLAAGADQWVAQCALDRGWSLQAILAAPVDDYAKSLPASDALRLRQQFLPRCQEISILADSPGGDSGYVAVAHALARQASALIALWDGRPSRGPGGTADTVERFLMARPPSLQPAGSDRRVYWVRARRRGEGSPAPGPAWQVVRAVGPSPVQGRTRP